MQLDHAASDTLDERQANLVLVPQGIDRFAQRILQVQERRPKVAVCVVHELLTTNGDDAKNRFSMAGVRKSLTAQASTWLTSYSRRTGTPLRCADLKPAADTRENALERLESELDEAGAELTSWRDEVRQFELIRDAVEKIQRPSVGGAERVLSAVRAWNAPEASEPQLLTVLATRLKRAREELDEAAKKKARSGKETRGGDEGRTRVARPANERRVGEVDQTTLPTSILLIIPRYTTEDAMKGPGVEASLRAEQGASESREGVHEAG